MKSILFVIPTMRMGGAEKSLVTLLNCMNRKHYKIDLLLFESGGVLQSDIPKDVNIISADKITQAMILEFRYYGKNLIREHHYIAYLHRLWISIDPKIRKNVKFGWKYLRDYIPVLEKEYDTAISYLEGMTAFYVIDKVKAKKKIGWIHMDLTGRIMPEEERRYYERFDHVITISEACKKVFINFVPLMKKYISVLENITDAETLKRKSNENADFSGWNENTIQIVTVGRLDFQKGIDLAIQACKLLCDRRLEICWHVYGEGVQRKKLEKMIKENDLKDVFVLEGMKENPYPYMKNADIIVQPSRYEGKSIVLDEAKLLEKAIVVTNYPSVQDQIVNRKTGLIVEGTPHGISDGIELLIHDKILRKDLEKRSSDSKRELEKILTDFYRILDT